MKKSLTQTRLAILAITTLFIPLAFTGAAQAKSSKPATYTEKVLYSFAGNTTDGILPFGGLIQDSTGTLYGTTVTGGTGVGNPACPWTLGCGTVYKLDKTGKETVLHFFTGGSDGGGPTGTLVLDSQGNLYGTTAGGGDPTCQCGVAYKLSPSGVLTVLHAFTDAAYPNSGPYAGLVRDNNGNLFGTTQVGGANQEGSIFEIDANGNYSVLHNFNVWDGLWGYLETLTLDAAGNLYGLTTYGGSGGNGTVFKMNPSGKLTVRYSFTGGKDGSFPSGSVALDGKGNIYGETYEGGSGYGGNGHGVVFMLEGNGEYRVLYTFPAGSGGSYGGGIILDPTGTSLYGTTSFDGANGRGSVFSIGSNGQETDLYSFTGGTDGNAPWAPVMEDANGNLYGTTTGGGALNDGIVFELVRQ